MCGPWIDPAPSAQTTDDIAVGINANQKRSKKPAARRSSLRSKARKPRKVSK